VVLPPPLRIRTGNQSRVEVEAGTLRDVIEALDREYPGLRFNLCYETGELRTFVNIFVNGDNVRYLQDLDTTVPAGATLHVLQSVAGG
jgi:molybdopterin synthase sulfur carrier subunit